MQSSAAVKPDQAVRLEQDWIDEALRMLIEGGVKSVQINPLATRLGVTRGGFYWRFRNRQDLLDHLLAHWENTNTRSLLVAVGRSGSPRDRFRRLVRLWIDEKDFDPALDTAVRQWGTIDPAVRAKVRQADLARIEAIAEVFRDAGQEALEATARARIIYFHQIGYYALGLGETQRERREFVDISSAILTGLDD